MLSDNYVPEKYAGNGTTPTFSFGWAILAEANIRVYLENATTLVQTAQVLGSDFNVVSGWDANGGSIEFTDAPSTGYNVIIARDISETQEVVYKTSSGFPAKVVENSFDKVTALVQDVAELAARCLRYPVGTSDSVSREMVAPGTDAGYPYWDGSAYDFVTAITATGDYPGEITRGTDASKSASPAVGDIHVATDTEILYICFTAGSWVDYNQDIVNKNVIQTMSLTQTVGGGVYSLGNNAQYQSFTPLRDMYVSVVELERTAPLNGVSTVRISIETDNADAPSGTRADGSSTADVSLPNTAAWHALDFGQTIFLEKATKYWFKIQEVVTTNNPRLSHSPVDSMPDEEWINQVGTRFDEDLTIKLYSGSFVVGDAVKVSSSAAFEKAQADSEANSKSFIGIVETVNAVSYYTFIDIVMGGVIDGLSSLVAGSLYYLDTATAGDITATKPTTVGSFAKPVLAALSSTTGIVINQAGVEVIASTTDIVFYENDIVSYENEVVYNQ